MAVEFSRTTAVKTITLPNSQTVKLPVLTKVSFIDAYDRYQETQHSIDNSSESSRTPHVVNVYPSGNHAATPIQVERVDEWPVFDTYDRGQETRVAFDNINGEANNPPSFDIANGGSHLKTHTVKYYHNINDKNSNWVSTEYIDQFTVVDPYDRDQETVYTLINPTQEQADAMNLASDPDITDAALDPPYRTDPFQNIVNFSSGTSLTLQWIYAIGPILVHLPGAGDSGVCDILTDPGSTVVGQYATAENITLFSGPTIPPGFTVSGIPSVSPDSFSFGDWTVLGSPGFTTGLHLSTSATVNVSDEQLLSLGIGFYGDSIGAPGIKGGAIAMGTVSIGTVSIDATSITVSSGGPSWTRSYAEIAVSVGGFTITQVFTP